MSNFANVSGSEMKKPFADNYPQNAVKFKSESMDVGFFEADIIASMEDAAQSHIKWIYDCLMAKMGNNSSLRMSQSDRLIMSEKALSIYQSYMKKIISKR